MKNYPEHDLFDMISPDLIDEGEKIYRTGETMSMMLGDFLEEVFVEHQQYIEGKKEKERRSRLVSTFTHLWRANRRRLTDTWRVARLWHPASRDAYPGLTYSHFRLCITDGLRDHTLADACVVDDLNVMQLADLKAELRTGEEQWVRKLRLALANVLKAKVPNDTMQLAVNDIRDDLRALLGEY